MLDHLEAMALAMRSLQSAAASGAKADLVVLS